ncbi:hypothetical protein BD779DRAFT_498020 [Infundibulicybe gibba]|nr:hypothetical protein BD779DRAFT_498020 [Infundibulicybe gibba]
MGIISSRDAPLLLIKVCRRWREVALSTPLLWSRLPPLQGHLKDGYAQLFRLYLENSARTALSIRFRIPQDPDDTPFLSLITPYLSRSQYLSISYFLGIRDLEPCVAHEHFPLLKSLELSCQSLENTVSRILQGQLTIMGLEGMKFPWAQLTHLTIQFHNTIETLTLLRNCSSLETFRLRISRYTRPGISHTPPEQKTVHHYLRTISLKMIRVYWVFRRIAWLSHNTCPLYSEIHPARGHPLDRTPYNGVDPVVHKKLLCRAHLINPERNQMLPPASH